MRKEQAFYCGAGRLLAALCLATYEPPPKPSDICRREPSPSARYAVANFHVSEAETEVRAGARRETHGLATVPRNMGNPVAPKRPVDGGAGRGRDYTRGAGFYNSGGACIRTQLKTRLDSGRFAHTGVIEGIRARALERFWNDFSLNLPLCAATCFPV